MTTRVMVEVVEAMMMRMMEELVLEQGRVGEQAAFQTLHARPPRACC
jgi:hypothetical protein